MPGTRIRTMFFIWIISAGLLQATVLTDLNLLVALSVFSGYRKGPTTGLATGAFIGAFAGILSSTPLGLNVGLHSMVGFAAGMVRTRIYYDYKENIFMEFMFSFIGAALFYSAYFILTGKIQPSIFSAAVLTAAISPLLFRLVEGRDREISGPLN